MIKIKRWSMVCADEVNSLSASYNPSQDKEGRWVEFSDHEKEILRIALETAQTINIEAGKHEQWKINTKQKLKDFCCTRNTIECPNACNKCSECLAFAEKCDEVFSE